MDQMREQEERKRRYADVMLAHSHSAYMFRQTMEVHLNRVKSSGVPSRTLLSQAQCRSHSETKVQPCRLVKDTIDKSHT
eukprot:3675897-Amphidinium_carterae.1